MEHNIRSLAAYRRGQSPTPPSVPLSLFRHGSVFRHIFVGASPRRVPQSRKDRFLRKRTKSQKFTQNGSKYQINTKDLFLCLSFPFFNLFKSPLVVYVLYILGEIFILQVFREGKGFFVGQDSPIITAYPLRPHHAPPHAVRRSDGGRRLR